MRWGRPAVGWLAAVLSALAFFYALDHLVMGMQGLPLNLDLSPAQ